MIVLSINILAETTSTNTLLEGENKIYTLGNIPYSITLNYVDNNEAKFTVNNEPTSKLKVSESYILSDGGIITITDIVNQNYPGVINQATFSLTSTGTIPVKSQEKKDSPLVCKSTNTLLKGELGTYKMGEAETVIVSEISKNDIFILDGNTVMYKGADSTVKPSPLIKLLDKTSGNIITSNVEVQDSKATFSILLNGKTYPFESVSDPHTADYKIKSVTTPTSLKKTYEIVPFIIESNPQIGENQVKLSINGQQSENLIEGASYQLPFGVTLSIQNIISQYYAGGIHSVSFCLNGEKGIKVSTKTISPEIVTTPITTPSDLSNYPNFLIEKGKSNAYFVVGSKSPSTDNLAMTDIAAGLTNSGYTLVDIAKLDSEINDPLHTNLVVIGKSSDNDITNILFNGAGESLKEGEGMIKLLENNGYVQMIVTGHSPEDTRKVAKVLQNYKKYNLQGKELIVTGSLTEPIVTESSKPIEIKPATNTLKEKQQLTTPTPTIEAPKEEKCTGCKIGGNCLPYGTRLVQDSMANFCNIDGILKLQQDIDASCQNNYECASNQCSNGKCIDISAQLKETNSFLEKMLNWFKQVFG